MDSFDWTSLIPVSGALIVGLTLVMLNTQLEASHNQLKALECFSQYELRGNCDHHLGQMSKDAKLMQHQVEITNAVLGLE